MRLLQRAAGMALLAALCILPVGALAQDNDTINVGGSGIAAPLFESLVSASGVEAAIETTVTGTNAGFAEFCAGNLDATLSTRAINDADDATCAANAVNYVEVLLGYDALALIVNPEGSTPSCVNNFTLNNVFAPSVSGSTIQWSSLDSTLAADDITLVLPPANTSASALLDNLVSGDGLRGDITPVADYAAVIAAVSADKNALGVVSLAAAQAAEGVELLQLNEAGTCYDADITALENGVYPASQPLYAYINAESLSNAGFRDVLAYVVGEDAAATVTEAGYVGVSDESRAINLAGVTEGVVGRTFSLPEPTYNIPPNITGTVNVGGSASAFNFFSTLVQGTIAQAYAGLTVNTNFEGTVAGARRLCNGELDLLVLDRALTAEELSNCEANNVNTFELPLGAQTVVLVASESADYLSCVTTEQLSSIWAASADAPTTWNQVNSDWAEAPVYLFAPSFGDTNGDLLLGAVQSGLILRAPTENNDDPLYRAAAVANAGSGLTYMRFDEYERVIENGQTGIQLVSVDAGEGCVAPSLTAQDAAYPLARRSTLVVPESSVENEAVKSLLWLLFQNSNFATLSASGFTGVTLNDFETARETLLTKFDEATARIIAREAVQATPEATPEEGGEPTAEVEATEAVEPTPEPEATEAEATEAVEPTPEAEATEAVEPTPEAEATETVEPTATPSN